MSNKRFLKAYVEYDGTGRVLPGSLVLRGNKPRVGTWGEIPAYQCCNPSVKISDTVSAGSEPGFIKFTKFEIICGESHMLDGLLYVDDTMEYALGLLNSYYGFLGTWVALNPATIELQMKEDVAKHLCSNETLYINFPSV